MSKKFGTHIVGPHMVVSGDGLKPGMHTEKQGVRFETLTRARKAAKSGDAIVRAADGFVLSVK